ncbi:MAG: DNA polymerase III subunit beta [Chlamydiales bacterium]|nr:DNA polymerase III subunit beta [Chlamydiia bacterium]MCP5508117.1 DNA polymerase III subunit beta [Chlamydiales bacterium]
MKFVISTQEFNYLLGKLLNVVAQKATIPILSNILVEAGRDQITLTATDLTVGVRCTTEAKVLEEGAITVPAKRLAQLVRELTAVNIQISTVDDVMRIDADSSYFKLHGMNRSEFPALPPLNDAAQIKMDQAKLKDMFFRTGFAVSREDNRYVLTGVFLHVQNGEATFVGTDGKRLAKTRMTVNIDSSFNGSYIIPLKAVDEVMKSLGDEGEATVYLMSDKIGFEASDCLVITKLLSGDYPDVDRVIPQKPDTVVSLHREELISLLRQVSLFTADTSHSVRFTFSNGELKLTANTMEIGEGLVQMPANYSGDKLEIAFNPGFFLDILRHSKGETVNLGMIDPFNPGLITDECDDAESPLFVLMPMRLNED